MSRLTKTGLGLAVTALFTAAPVSAQPAAAPDMAMPMPSGQPMGQPGIAYSGVAPVPENQAVLDALKTLGQKPYFTLTPAEARLQPSFTDGVMAAMRAKGLPTAPPPGTTERDITVRGAAGPLHALLIKPAGAKGPLPAILYFHGGGWVVADSKVYAGGARGLARAANAIVVSVDYRLAPEAPFPAQHDDALASYRWLLTNGKSLGIAPGQIAFAGESAGGNLAVSTAVQAKAAGLPLPLAILSVYPIAGADLNTPSYRENANAAPLNRAAMAWFARYVPTDPAQLKDPRISVADADLGGLPPVTIVAAQIDPLRSDGELLAQRLQAAGVAVERREYPAVTHEFFGADGLIPAAADAQQWAGGRLRSTLLGDGAISAAREMSAPSADAPPAPPPPPARGERG